MTDSKPSKLNELSELLTVVSKPTPISLFKSISILRASLERVGPSGVDCLG